MVDHPSTMTPTHAAFIVPEACQELAGERGGSFPAPCRAGMLCHHGKLEWVVAARLADTARLLRQPRRAHAHRPGALGATTGSHDSSWSQKKAPTETARACTHDSHTVHTRSRVVAGANKGRAADGWRCQGEPAGQDHRETETPSAVPPAPPRHGATAARRGQKERRRSIEVRCCPPRRPGDIPCSGGRATERRAAAASPAHPRCGGESCGTSAIECFASCHDTPLRQRAAQGAAPDAWSGRCAEPTARVLSGCRGVRAHPAASVTRAWAPAVPQATPPSERGLLACGHGSAPALPRDAAAACWR